MTALGLCGSYALGLRISIREATDAKMGKLCPAVAVVGSLLAASAKAATSASLILQGIVMINSGLLITPQSGYNSLDILGGVNNKSVATVTEHSNGINGYIVTLRSANAYARSSSQATLDGTGNNTDRVPYTIIYNSQIVTLDGTGTATVTSTTTRSSRYGDTKNLKVTISPTWVSADTYSDTLILTLRHNN